MNAKRKTIAAVFLFTVAVCAVFGLWNHKNMNKKEGLSQAETQADDVWEQLDRKDLRESFFVDESFASALPFVVLDTRPGEAEAKASGGEIEAEPYIRIKLSVIDHDNKMNLLGDEPTAMAFGKLKEAGIIPAPENSPKKQYLLRLEIEDGQPFSMKIFGMDQSEAWLLYGFQTDGSYLRDYISLNAANALSPEAQDMRFGEVIFRYAYGYEYMGLYGIYGMEEQTQAEKDRILNDIKIIEECLYSDQDAKFLEYRDLLDVDSFVDYFIINEFFSNDTNGWDSSCFYKDLKGKIHIRITGGFDSSINHESRELLEIQGMGLPSALWFERLVTDEYFVDKTVKRYQELRKTVLNQDLLDKKLDSAIAGIRVAALTDRKRWPGLYQEQAMEGMQDQDTGFTADHSRNTWEEEAQRLKDTIRLRGNCLDEQITGLYELVHARNNQRPRLFLAICFITSFFVSVIVVQRVRNGSR